MNGTVDHHMIEIYCFVDEFLKTHPALAGWRRSPHAQPQFSDAEVLWNTIQLKVLFYNLVHAGILTV